MTNISDWIATAICLLAAAIIPLSADVVMGGFTKSESTVNWMVIALSVTSAGILLTQSIKKTGSFIIHPVPASVSISAVILILFILYSIHKHPGALADIHRHWLIMSLLCYMSFRTLFSQWESRLLTFITITLCICVIWQSVLLFMQLAGTADGQASTMCTGSFTNPGLLGGVLAISITLTAPYISKTDSPKWIRTICITSTISGLVSLVFTNSRASMLAIAVFSFIWLIHNGKHKVALCLIVIYIAAGTLLYFEKKDSADIRFYMDRNTIEIIKGNKWHGTGPGSFPGTYANFQFSKFSSGKFSEEERLEANIPSSCCNELLETGVEYGPATMLLTAMLMGWVFFHGKGRYNFWYPLLAWSVISLFSYPMASFCLRYLGIMNLAGTVSTISIRNQHENKGKKNKSHPWIMSFILVIGASIMLGRQNWVKKRVTATHEYWTGQMWYKQGNYRSVVRNWEPISEYLAHSHEFLYQYGIALSEIGLYEKSDSVLRLHNSISADPAAYLVMGDGAMERHDFEKAQEYYTHSFRIVPNRILPLARLAELHRIQNDSARYRQMVDSVVHFKPKIDNQMIQIIKNEVKETYEKWL